MTSQGTYKIFKTCEYKNVNAEGRRKCKANTNPLRTGKPKPANF